MGTTNIREARPDEIDQLLPLLLLAEPSEPALRWGLRHLSDTVYRMDDGDTLVGAATMKWRDDPCELMEIGIRPDRQGQGLGRQFLTWIFDEARARGKRRLLVGTENNNLAAISFYQKCGMRMDHVRQDYFQYYREPVYQNGIQTQDMLVFRYDLDASDRPGSVPRPKKGR